MLTLVKQSRVDVLQSSFLLQATKVLSFMYLFKSTQVQTIYMWLAFPLLVAFQQIAPCSFPIVACVELGKSYEPTYQT